MDLIIKFKKRLYIDKKKSLNDSANITDANKRLFKGVFNKKQLIEIAQFKKKFKCHELIANKNILYYENNKIIFNKQNTVKTLLTIYGDQLTDELNNISNEYSEKQRKFMKYLNDNDIKQLYIDKYLKKFKRIYRLFDLSEYSDPEKPCLFFGYYTNKQLERIYNHKGNKYIMFGGSDVTEKTDVDHDFDNIQFISISKNMHHRLNNMNIKNILFELDLVDYKLFKKLDKKGPNIFVYDQPYDCSKNSRKANQIRYNIPIINKLIKRLPQYNFILNSSIYLKYEDMPNVYKKCFIGLRLTTEDGNANMVQELNAMGIPAVHNSTEYGLKWNNINDIINYINIYYNLIVKNNFNIFNINKINFDNNIHISENLDSIKVNINYFTLFLKQYKNILFISAGYPGYGGAATNCHNLSEFYKKDHNVKCIYWKFKADNYSNKDSIEEKDLENILRNMDFRPDIVILKSYVNLNLRNILKCPIVFLVPGIFNDNLNKDYSKLSIKKDYDKNINKKVIIQIINSDIVFCNSFHTQSILKNIYKLNTYLFYSTFIKYYDTEIKDNKEFNDRKYDYGLIISNFNRPIKNAKKSIKFLKKQVGKKIILIGKESEQYKDLGFKTVGLIDYDKMNEYYQDIKFIIQDSHYESCSNVMVEAMFNGCERRLNIIVSSTQYPGYGGAATSAYRLIKYLRKKGHNVCGLFFHNKLDVPYDPDNLKGIFLFKNIDKNIYKTCCNYLDEKPDLCMAKNYLAPIYCKKIFNCHTIYLVSGINHFNLFYPDTSAQMMLESSFKINKVIKEEVLCNKLVDEIIMNSDLTKQIFEKIYPRYKNKIKDVSDTSYLYSDIDLEPYKNKEYDIVICSSNWKRSVKNGRFLVKLFGDERMNKYKKVVIGDNYQPFAFFPNTICKGLIKYKKCLETMNKCKIILCPSLFDSNPGVLVEATKLGCEPILTKNVGSYKKYSEDSICYSYDINEWLKKIEFFMNKIK